MKQSSQNEMDLLLRQLGKVKSTDLAEPGTPHLDADELSAFAENALPELARAKYMEHIVDCTRCRQIVTQLTPPLTAQSIGPATSPSFLAGFFSKLKGPSFWRYAGPGLAAVLILSVAVVLLRRQRSEYVAQNSESQRTTITRPEETPPTATSDTAANAASGDGVNTSKGNTQGKPASTEERAKSVATSSPVDEMSKETAASRKPDSAKPSETVAAEPAAAPPPKPVEVDRVARNTEIAEKKKAAAEEDARAKTENRVLADSANSQGAGQAQNAPAARRAVSVSGIASRGRIDAERDKDAKADQEVRTIAGRRFHKVDGVWTDLAYSSGATISLSRGSEQYRALIADEPQIAAIAEQLSGEVIVVWKGRTYRIR